MKTVPSAGYVLALIIFLLSTGPALANDIKPQSAEAVRAKIEKMIQTPDLDRFGIKKAEIKLKFLINDKEEMVVVSTGTDNTQLDTYIKNRLNYKTLRELPKRNKIYVLEIMFRANKD